jgi:hypothetical protein
MRRFIREFLKQADGGTRLVSVVAAFVHLLNSDAEVKVYAPNVSDKFAKTAGDIEIYVNKELVSAFECKDRQFTANDISHGLRKGVEHEVREYIFVSGPGLEPPEIDVENEGQKRGIDSTWLSIDDVLDGWTLALRPNRRSVFGKQVIQHLLAMRRQDVAQEAEKTWKGYFGS